MLGGWAFAASRDLLCGVWCVCPDRIVCEIAMCISTAKKKKGPEFQTAAAARPCFFLLNPGATRDGQMQFTAAMWGNGDGRKGKERKKGTRKRLASYVTAAKPTAKPFCFAVTGWSDWCVRAPWPGGSPQYIIIYFSLLFLFFFGVTEG